MGPEEVKAGLGGIRWLDATKLRLFRDDSGRIRATLEDELSLLHPSLWRAFPVSDPDRYLELRDGGGEPIGMLRELAAVGPASRPVADELLLERYFIPRIVEVFEVRSGFGLWSFDVMTDRGERRFAIRSPREDIRHLSRGLRITDTDSNIYEIEDIASLPALSRRELERIV